MNESLIDAIVAEVLREMKQPPVPQTDAVPPPITPPLASTVPEQELLCADFPLDIVAPQAKATPLLAHPQHPQALDVMMKSTTARIGVGRAGPRLKTQTMLAMRADHAAAKDAVMMDVGQELLETLNLFSIQSRCHDKDEFLTRPDLGRMLSEEGAAQLKKQCTASPDVQIYVSDGLSSSAVEANAATLLPVLMDGLQEMGCTVGTPFFVRFGRVGAMDEISQLLDAKVTCVLLGERPGLGSAESMSAYIAYRATVGMVESRRTVVSNIHKNGIAAVEAGAYLCDVIQMILKAEKSGVELKERG